MIRRYGAQWSASSFRILAGIISGPVALLGLRRFSRLRIPSVVMSISGIVGEGSPSIGGIEDVSSCVKTDWYCRLRIFALSSGSLCSFPLSLSGATPQLSFLRELM